jgi:hypothetical protein
VRQWPFEYRVTVRKETAGAPQVAAMAFEFQLPAARPVWQEGSVHATESGAAEAVPLSLESPDLLPPLEAPASGSVQFRLSSQGQELVRWEHPNVRVLPPVLERLAFRAPLHPVNLPNGLVLMGQTTDPIDGIGWKNQRPALFQNPKRFLFLPPFNFCHNLSSYLDSAHLTGFSLFLEN